MNKNVRYNDIKRADGTVTIALRFYGADIDSDDNWDYVDSFLIPVYVKALPITTAEIRDMDGLSELCRLNETKWEIVGAPKIAQKYIKHLVGQSIWAYYNGNECCWKFMDPCESSVDALITDKIADRLYEECMGVCYEPHCDIRGNFGNPKVHAVYDKRVKKLRVK